MKSWYYGCIKTQVPYYSPSGRETNPAGQNILLQQSKLLIRISSIFFACSANLAMFTLTNTISKFNHTN